MDFSAGMLQTKENKGGEDFITHSFCWTVAPLTHTEREREKGNTAGVSMKNYFNPKFLCMQTEACGPVCVPQICTVW